MMSHDGMISAKVAMLEALVTDLLVGKFLAMPNGVAEAEAYAERRKALRAGATPDADLELARQEIWTEFLDRMITVVRREHPSSQR